MKDILIRDRYRVNRRIGKGGVGLVYSGTDIHTGNDVAIKLVEEVGGKELEPEVYAYEELAGEIGIPRVYLHQVEDRYNVLIFELLGPSLEDLFNYCSRKFSLKTILLIADQAICRIERIHRRFLHRDIKPGNFLLGTGKQGNILYTIDFGLSTIFPGHYSVPRFEGSHFVGTFDFASIDSHMGLEQSWGADLESLGYMLIYFARGSLPWQGLSAETVDQEGELIKQMKNNSSAEELCQGVLPPEFAKYLDYTRSLSFRQKPNYRYLRNLFRARFRSEGFKYDNIFDWTIKRFDEVQARADKPTRRQRLV
ncbi:casein kinase I isoform delta [Nemania sp. FL0031]|nr:casein kinase I isoform delta [Nemania sp. FL0031]